tara:strand:+ start:110 stop:1420 length:1311 start_codon:yes stop_codon:yes gene_type:complete
MARSRGLLSVPKHYKGSSPNSHWTELIYATQPEIEKLRELDMHKSGIGKEDHYGPGGLLSMDGGGAGDPIGRKINYSTYDKNLVKKAESPPKAWGPMSYLQPNKKPSYMDTNPKPATIYAGPGHRSASGAFSTADKGPADLNEASKIRENLAKPYKQTVDEATKRDESKPTGGGEEQRQCPSGTTGTWPTCTPITTEDPCIAPKIKKNGNCIDPPGTDDPTCRSGKKYPDTGSCIERCEDTMGEEYTGRDEGGGKGCKLKQDPRDDDSGGLPGAGSLNTILRPDQTPMLQTLTDEMDLRNMLGSVLNKNNPLFKQARTRALQAMAARGVVNSTMAEEAVMSAIMGVAMPIATRVIDDFQRVMAANVNATNAFKAALNQAYYNELLARVDAANTYNLTSMQESRAAWRTKMEMYTGAKDIESKEAFDRYMAMISGAF